LGIFTVAALAASVTFDVAAAQRGDRSDGTRGASAATSGGAAVSQPPPSGPGKLPSAGEISAPTSAVSKRVDTPAATGMGKPPSSGEIPKPTSAASQRVDTPAPTGMGKPPSPTGERTATTRSSANAAATGRVEGRATSGRTAMASSSIRTTDRYAGTYRRGDRYSGGYGYYRGGARYYDNGWGWGGFGTGLAVGAATAPYWGGYGSYARPYAYNYVYAPRYGYGGPYYAAAYSGPSRRCLCR